MGNLSGFHAAEGKYEEVPCCLCGEPPRPYAVDYRSNRLAVCARCGFRFVSPRPLFSTLVENVYDDKYYSDNAPQAESEETYQAYLDSIRKYKVPGGLLFDVGAGGGGLLAAAARNGWEIEGLDVQPVQVERLRKKLNCKVHLGLLEDIEAFEARYDVITLSHVLEHTLNPVEFLNKCFEGLKPGGLLYAVLPNTASLGDRVKDLLSAHGLKSRPYKHLAADHHLWFFTPGIVRELVKKTGFRELSLKTIFPRRRARLLNSPLRPVLARLGLATWIELVLRRP